MIRYHPHMTEEIELRPDHHIWVKLADEPREVDMRKWKLPPHVALANLDIETAYAQPEVLIPFMRRYGPVGVRDDLRSYEGWHWVDFPAIDGMRRVLRAEWEGQKDELEDMQIALSADAELAFGPKGVDIVATDLWTLIRILFFQDKAAGRIALCPVKHLRTPYFVRERQGQEYCSHECAVLMANRRYRREALGRKAQRQDKPVPRRGNKK